jgi:uncharacterized protein
MQKLPQTVKNVWRWRLFFILLGTMAIILLTSSWFVHWWFWLGVIAGIILLCGVLTLTILIPYNYAFHQYAIYENRVEIKKGFIIQRESTIPIARIQNVNVKQGPLLKKQNLCEISIETAGDEHTIAAVTKAESEQIRQRVMTLAMEARNAI